MRITVTPRFSGGRYDAAVDRVYELDAVPHVRDFLVKPTSRYRNVIRDAAGKNHAALTRSRPYVFASA